MRAKAAATACIFSFFAVSLLAEEVTLPLQVDGETIHFNLPTAAPPLSLASDICATYHLIPAGGEACDTLISSEIHRLQSVKLASKGTLSADPHSLLNVYYQKANALEESLRSAGHEITEGHIGMIPRKLDYLYRLAASPLVRTIVQVGMNAGHSAVLFLEANSNAKVVSIDVGYHEYTSVAANILHEWYGDRHSFVSGSSQQVFAAALDQLRNASFASHHRRGNRRDDGDLGTSGLLGPLIEVHSEVDLLFIDGDHGYQGALADLLLGCELLAHQPRIDDVDPILDPAAATSTSFSNDDDDANDSGDSRMSGVGAATITTTIREHATRGRNGKGHHFQRQTLVVMDDVGRGCHHSPVRSPGPGPPAPEGPGRGGNPM
jgi:hypothetical protein